MRKQSNRKSATATYSQHKAWALAAALLMVATLLLAAQSARGEDKKSNHPTLDQWESMSDSEREALRKEVMERMRSMRTWRMTDELKLDEKQAAKVFPLLARMDAKDLDVAKQKIATIKTIRETLEQGEADSRKLAKLADTMIKLRAKQNKQEIEKLEALSKLLKPEQQARMVLLVPRLEREFHRHIRNAVGARFSDREHRHRHRKRWPDKKKDD